MRLHSADGSTENWTTEFRPAIAKRPLGPERKIVGLHVIARQRGEALEHQPSSPEPVSDRRLNRPAPPDILPALRRNLVEVPVEGKTFSLFGPSTDDYYRGVAALVDRLLLTHPGPIELLRFVRETGGSRRRLKRLARGASSDGAAGFLVSTAAEALGTFTRNVTTHLETLPLRSRLDRTLSMSREQYHLAMLEIEVMNRIHAESFRRTDKKLAFLPHCLKERRDVCRSEREAMDYVCKGCSKGCWINGVSKLLRLNGITPYIWMEANLAGMFRKTNAGSLGVVGVACVPELVRGMRLCMRHRVPVLGLPLNANRCARWMGTFCPNSVNLSALARLVAVR